MSEQQSVYEQRAALESRKKWLAAETKANDAAIRELGEQVLAQMAEDGSENVKLVTGETVYQHYAPRATVRAANWNEIEEHVKLAHQCMHAQNPDDYIRHAARKWRMSREHAEEVARSIAELLPMGRWEINRNSLSSWYRERLNAFVAVANKRQEELEAEVRDKDAIEAALVALLKTPIAPLPGPLADLVGEIAKPSIRVRGAKPVAPVTTAPAS